MALSIERRKARTSLKSGTSRSFRGVSFFIARPEAIRYCKGELFEVTAVLVFGSVHAERDVLGVGVESRHFHCL